VPDYSIFTGVTGPSSDAGDPVFQVSVTCWVKSIRFWRGATSINGVQKGRIFTVGGEAIVPGTAVDFPALSGTGWQVATLAAPVQLLANTSYKVCVHFTDNYSATGGYWASGAGVGGRTDGPLTAPDAGGTPLGLGNTKQGSFAVTANPDTYPDNYFNGGNYWIDVLVADVDPGAAQTLTLGLPVEEDSALPSTVAKTAQHGLPAEQASALAASLTKTTPLGQATETSDALPLVLAKAVTVGLPVETAQALAVTLGKSLTHGLPVEQSAALAVVLSEAVRLGLSIEVDQALTLLVNDVWPPSTLPPATLRWATGQAPTQHRWASTGPPVTA
jgi:hypothetical protein